MKLTINGPSLNQEFSFKGSKVSIGRDESCDWTLPSNKLSKVHCEIIHNQEKHSFYIIDKNSKNGVIVDGEKIEPNILKPINENSTILLASEFILTMNFGEKVNQVEKLYSMKVQKEAAQKTQKSQKKKTPDYKIIGASVATLIALGILLKYLNIF